MSPETAARVTEVGRYLDAALEAVLRNAAE
jgi:hypothetical protein